MTAVGWLEGVGHTVQRRVPSDAEVPARPSTKDVQTAEGQRLNGIDAVDVVEDVSTAFEFAGVVAAESQQVGFDLHGLVSAV